ncbi:hypothetical protein TIFTF001_016502 [Ficus carica]|uniref:Uncharacterized protein n=1 Tax=Ficus carica TaxID=3494 RepID=A0AA88D682_FICCA|nr:hypothetical protein TIFTF001_016502 [Ficus carica]
MDKASGKQPIEDDLVDWTSSDSDENDTDDEEGASVIRRLKDEYESLQMRKGTEISNEASERSRPTTVSGAGVLSIPPIARLNKPPRLLSVEMFLTSNPPSILTDEDLSAIRGRYGFPNEFFLGLIVIADEAGVELSVDDILALYYLQENSKDHGRYSMYPRRKRQVVANAFYPLWGLLRKESKKPPPKALLFE